MSKYKLLLLALALIIPSLSEAHQSGCHRWHSCPSDTGSYVCGDLGYTSGCPTSSVTNYTSPVRTFTDYSTYSTFSDEDLIPSLSGSVAYSDYSCDYFISNDDNGYYSLLEWYSGNQPTTGDLIYGNFNSYGFKDIYTGSFKSKTHVWIDDYLLSKDRVIEKYIEKCNLDL